MDVIRFINIFLRFYQICGICTTSSRKSSIHQILLTCWACCYLVILFIILIFVYIYEDIIFANSDPVSKFVDVIQLVGPILTHFIVIIEAMLHRAMERKIWKIISIIEKSIDSLGLQTKSFNSNYQLNYILKVLSMHVVSVATELYIISTISLSPEWMRHWLARLLSFIVGRAAIMQYILYIDYMTSRIFVVKDELKSLIDYSGENRILLKFDHFLCGKIKIIKDIYGFLWKLSCHVNERFDYFMLSILTSFFICVTVDLYWIYANLRFQTNLYMIQSFLCLIPPVTTLLILFYSCENCIRNARFVGCQLHAIQRSAIDRYTSKVISQFSLQILHEQIYLSVVGFFDLNYDLLKAMSAVITTYMVIIIGFMPSENIFKNLTASAETYEVSIIKLE